MPVPYLPEIGYSKVIKKETEVKSMFGKSAEDKAAEKQAKQEAKDKAAMEKFGLDFDSYTEADIRRKNINSAKEIAGSLAGSKLYSFGSLLLSPLSWQGRKWNRISS